MSRRRPHARARGGGFTLAEVMIALAILGIGLVMLIKHTANNILKAEDANMIGVTTELARGKMNDLEEKLMKDGFQDTSQHEDDLDFDDEGWPTVHYSYAIDEVELPDLGSLQAAKSAAGAGSGSGSGSGSGAGAGSGSAAGPGGFENSGIGGMISMFGGGGEGSAATGADAAGAGFIQSQFELVKQVLKASIRKVSLTLTWTVMGFPRDMLVVAYFTDPAGMNKVLGSLGATAPADGGGGGGGGARQPTPSTGPSRLGGPR